MTETTASMGDVAIDVRDLAYGTPEGRPLIQGLSFRIRRGEIGVVTGPNGLGKSTLLKVLLGVQKPAGGVVTLAGAKGGVAYLPQTQNRAFHMPLLLQDVVELGCEGRRRSQLVQDLARINLLTPEQLERPWNRASGGERQKALLTMTLLQQKPIVLLDEPLNHLDAQGQGQCAAALRLVTTQGQKTILLVSHRPLLADDGVTSVVSIPLEQYAVGGLQ